MVDWCGCSPNDFTPGDAAKLNGTLAQDIFFARKFEPVVSQEVLNLVDSTLLQGEFDPEEAQENGHLWYWQNLYHHLDASPAPSPELMSVATSLGHAFAESNGLGMVKVLEADTHHFRDKLQGVSVTYLLRQQSGAEVGVQVVFRPKAPKATFVAGERPVDLAIGTQFDPKEIFFRNLLGAIGPRSEPQLMYRVPAGPEPVNMTVAWYDPAGAPAYVSHHTFNESAFEDVAKTRLEAPLRPGVWTVLVFRGGDRAAKMHFLVTPILQEVSRAEDAEVRKMHSGPEKEKQYPKVYSELFQEEVGQEVQDLAREAEENGRKTSEDLRRWAMSLAQRFYPVLDACTVEGSVETLEEGGGPRAARGAIKGLKWCLRAAWSTYSPDPKSEVGEVNPKTGRLF